MFGKSKKNLRPPVLKPKPKVTRELVPSTKMSTDTQHRNSAPDTTAKEEEIVSNTNPTIKQPTVEDDEYLVPSRVDIGSDEYVKLEIETQNHNETIAKSKDEVLVNASVSSDVHHLHIHIHIPPSQTDDNKVKQWKVVVGRSDKNTNKVLQEEAPKLPPKPASTIPPPSPAPPPRTYKDRDSASKTEQDKQSENESSVSSQDESDVDAKTIDTQEGEVQENYEEITFGGSAEKDANEDDSVTPSSDASQKEAASPRETEVQSKEDHHPWLFQHTESARVEDLLKTDLLDGRFAVIQEDEEVMPFTPYTLIVVQNGQLKRVPIMKKETAGRAKYSLADSKDKKSIDDLVTYFKAHEIKGLKLKLKPPEGL